jgi:hypothetical protein
VEPSFAQPEKTAKPVANPARASKPLSDTRKERPSLIRRQVRSDHRPASSSRPGSFRRYHPSSFLALLNASNPTADKDVVGAAQTF